MMRVLLESLASGFGMMGGFALKKSAPHFSKRGVPVVSVTFGVLKLQEGLFFVFLNTA